ncbi:MAG: hypothetical protein V3T81_07370 [Thermoanaerobaculia bacterium]
MASVRHLAQFDSACAADGRSSEDLAATILALASATLEDLAAEEFVDQLRSRVRWKRG